MKFDYKPKPAPKRSPILKRTMHVTAGFVAFVFVSFLLTNTQSESIATQTSVTLPINLPEASPSKPSIATNLEAKEQPKVTIAELKIPASTPKPNALFAKPQENLPAAMPEPEISEAESTLAEAAAEEIPVLTEKTIKVRKGDTLPKIFAKIGISTQEAHDIMSSEKARGLRSLRAGQVLKLQVNQQQQLASLSINLAPGSTVNVSRQDSGFQVEHKIIPLQKQMAFAKSSIQKSLFTSGKRAGLDQNILGQMVEIFGRNIDFSLDLKPNDTFRVLYEEKRLDGERIQTGVILAAEIVSGGTKHQAVRYTDKSSGKTAYYAPDGSGLNQAFLRSPVDFTRISSHFGDRNHPVLHRMRKHMGVDYAAPIGTEIKATGEGEVTFIGTRSGYGKVIEIQHGPRYSTLYAHLSKFPKGLRAGSKVAQGQLIGYVGQTGVATGPHVHYEFRVDGIHRNPLTVTLPKKNLIHHKSKSHFIAHAKEMIRLLDLHENKINMARAEYPVNE